MSGTPCKALRALFMDKRHINAVFNLRDHSDVKLFHEVRRVAFLTYIANGSKLRKTLTMKA